MEGNPRTSSVHMYVVTGFPRATHHNALNQDVVLHRLEIAERRIWLVALDERRKTAKFHMDRI